MDIYEFCLSNQMSTSGSKTFSCMFTLIRVFLFEFNEYSLVGCETHFFFMQSEKEFEEIVRSVIEETDYKVIDLVIRGEKRTKVLELYVDRRDSVNIDELASISRRLEEKLESSPLSGEMSKIVLSSPGAERSFRFIWQLQKHIGRNLDVILNDGSGIEGTLLDTNEESGNIKLKVAASGKKKSEPVELDLNFGDIRESRVKISFSKK